MNRFILLRLIFLGITVCTLSLSAASTSPYESGRKFSPINEIDRLLEKDWSKKGIKPAGQCSDQTFIRRAYLDLTGSLPTVNDVKTFVSDKRPDKRELLIELLFNRDEFTEYWTMKWSDILRVKSEFPINLWPNAVQAYNRWISQAVKSNMPYDRFARELLTTSGSNFRDPQVNFYRAVQDRTPTGLASAAALTFMGCRFDSLTETQRKEMAKCFSRVAYKRTAEWKEEIICLDPKPAESMRIIMPDNAEITISTWKDPRVCFADWLTSYKNPWFAKAAVNRIWFWFFGRGIIHEADDIRLDNPPVNAELLAYLEKAFIDSNYNFKAMCRLIMNSAAYSQSPVPAGDYETAAKNFAIYPVRRLEAEVISDALTSITGVREGYTSVIPEPFTFVPAWNRTIALPDGSITSSFLENFGKSARDSGKLTERINKISAPQRLYLLNSTSLQRDIYRSWKIKQLIRRSNKKPADIVNNIYLMILSRYPSADELATIKNNFPAGVKNQQRPGSVLVDLIWALINSREFIYRH